MSARGFQLLLAGTVLSQTGQWMQTVALGWLVLDLTGSAFYLGLAGFLRSIPQLFLSLPGGILADRVDRGKLLGTAQGFAALFTLILAVLVATGAVQTWHVLALTFLSGSAMAMIFPVRQALVPDVVPRKDLANAVALSSAGNNVTRMAGPALAGVLIGLVGIAACFFLQAAGLLLALWTSLAIRMPPRTSAGPQAVRGRGPGEDLREAYQYIRRSPAIASLLAAAAIPTLFGMPYVSFLPVFARDFGIGASGLGLLMMAAGIGSVAGSIGFTMAGNFRRKGAVQVTCISLFGLSLLAFSFVSWLPGALALLACVGISSSVYMATNMTLLQTMVPAELRGRIISVYMLSWGLMPLGTLPLGAIADHFGAPVAVALGGGLCALFAVALRIRQPGILALE
jgi:MFS family permease